MTINDYVPEQFVSLFSNECFQDAIKGYVKYLVKEDEEFRTEIRHLVNDELDNSFELRLIHASSEPLNRLVKLETITGLTDFSEFYDDEEGIKQPRTPSIPERIKTLEDKIKNYSPGLTVSACIDKIPETKTEIRASLLVDALKASKKDYFSANEIMDFLKCKLPESCKIDEKVKNLRKVKQDVVKKAEEMFSTLVEANKKLGGHRDVRLVLKS